MRGKKGLVFSVAVDNAPVPGCTISEDVAATDGFAVLHFSLAAGTDISPESYANTRLWIVDSGVLTAYTGDGAQTWETGQGSIFEVPTNIPIGVRAADDSVYTEIEIKEHPMMNNAITPGTLFTLKDLVPYREGKIVNIDVAHNDTFKLAVMSFDEGTGLSEHAAPGDALVFALDGNGIIGYEGEEHRISVGENFMFAKGGRHYVKADGRFTMALLVQLA